MPQAVAEVVFEPPEHRDPLAEVGYARQSKLQKRVGGVDTSKELVAFSVERYLVVDRPLAREPLEAAGPDRRHNRHKVGLDLDNERVTRFIALEPVGLRCAGIPCPSIDLEGTVPIAEREIIELRQPGPIRGDLVLGLSARSKVPNRSVSDANPQPRARGLHRIKQAGRILEVMPVNERGGEQPYLLLDLAWRRFREDDDLVAGPLPDAVPQAAIAREVVVSRQEPPAAGMPIHPRDRLNDCPVFRPFGVEDVAGDDDVLGTVLRSRLPKRVNGVESGFRQRAADIGIEAAKGFAELPVGGVDEFHFALIAFVAGNGHSICSHAAQIAPFPFKPR